VGAGAKMPYKDEVARKAQKRRYNRLNREKVNAAERARRARDPKAFRATRLRHRYGIDHDQYRALFEAQNGLCALCRVRAAVDVDHDHADGRVRGLVCRACNVGMGLFGDDPRRMRTAAAFLEGDEPNWMPPNPPDYWPPPSTGQLSGNGG
jgi:hypothetical protein